ncbi:MAG: DUF58 domain-containing protein [Planctomycetaceae bacterium]
MRIRPGRFAIVCAAMIGLISLLGIFTWHIVWLMLILVIVGLYLALRDYQHLKHSFDSLRIERQLPAAGGRGGMFRVVWSLSSFSPSRLTGTFRDESPTEASSRLLEHTFALDPQQKEFEVSHSLTLPKRGRHTFGPLWVRLSGPYGFLDVQRSIPTTDTIRVLPETFAAVEYFRKEVGADIRMLDLPTRTHQHGEGTEFESLKEFRDGDDPRRIDWRATARARVPIVAKFQVERHRDVMILVDCGRLMGGAASPEFGSPTKLDSAIDAALMLGRSALDGGDRCGIGLFDHTVRKYLPPVSGRPALGGLVDSVFDAPVQWTESDFGPMFATLQSRQSKRSLIVVLSDVTDQATTDTLRGSLSRLTKRHVVLFVAIRTPYLDRMIHSPLTTLQEASRKGTIFRLQQEREETLQGMRHLGIQILDVPPHEVTVPLINQYVAIRSSNRL